MRWFDPYGDGIETEAALKKTLNVSIEDLQTSFDRALDTQFGGIRRAIHDSDTPLDGSSVEALRTNAAAKPDSYISQLALGKALATAGDAAAYAPLERAATLVPSAIGAESPHLLMAELAERLGDKTRAMKDTRRCWRSITRMWKQRENWRRLPSPLVTSR